MKEPEIKALPNYSSAPMSTGEAAIFLGRLPHTLEEWRRRKVGPVYWTTTIPGQTRKRVMYYRSDLIEFAQFERHPPQFELKPHPGRRPGGKNKPKPPAPDHGR